ncbi:cutinase family protein [Aeromicrobium sp. Marseille-Q0843]|uniref:Cutinase family protein n=1 Tax=Aeromicrobium phoceense TaxID=2754045 RepID=A0A838XFH1_9ACTN|nr:cutinase family protein [Aeromicrobium phoceense]MBA4608587.1 cutinase family protein [Aeromicrobium phoceense]
MLGRTVVLALACFALAGCDAASSGTPSEAEPSGCAAVEIVGIRGQGQFLEANDGLGTEVSRISAALADDLASLGTVRTTAIRHASGLGSWDEYLEDVRDGRDRLRTHLRSVAADCPDAKITVIGFSQGSQVARQELAADPRLARHVDVLVLVGSPVRDPSSPFEHVELTGGVPAEAGRLGPGPDLGELAERTVEACIAGDAVCAAGSSPDDTIHRHAYEDPDVAQAIAYAAATVLAG